MTDFMADSESTAYGYTHMKALWWSNFNYWSTAETILQDFHARQKDHLEEEKKYIIKAAAKLIKNDIKLVELQLKTISLWLKLKPKKDTCDVLISSLTLLRFC